MEILKKLIQIRKEKGIDQKSMLHVLGITHTTLSRYESYKRKIPLDVLIKYADYLGYELKLLIK